MLFGCPFLYRTAVPRGAAPKSGGLRHEAGLTQKELAQRCCVTSQAVSKWEHGISCPDILILDELADALHVSLQHLLAGR